MGALLYKGFDGTFVPCCARDSVAAYTASARNIYTYTYDQDLSSSSSSGAPHARNISLAIPVRNHSSNEMYFACRSHFGHSNFYHSPNWD